MKYKLTNNKKEHFGRTLFQIEATESFGSVVKGELGGYIEKEINLSQEGNAWVSGNAIVYGGARVSGNAIVSGGARASDNAEISGNAIVFGNAEISGNARVSGSIKLQSGWCFARKRKDWNVTELENGEEILLIKDYKPAEEDTKTEMTVKEIEERLGINNLKIVK